MPVRCLKHFTQIIHSQKTHLPQESCIYSYFFFSRETESCWGNFLCAIITMPFEDKCILSPFDHKLCERHWRFHAWHLIFERTDSPPHLPAITAIIVWLVKPISLPYTDNLWVVFIFLYDDMQSEPMRYGRHVLNLSILRDVLSLLWSTEMGNRSESSRKFPDILFISSLHANVLECWPSRSWFNWFGYLVKMCAVISGGGSDGVQWAENEGWRCPEEQRA